MIEMELIQHELIESAAAGIYFLGELDVFLDVLGLCWGFNILLGAIWGYRYGRWTCHILISLAMSCVPSAVVVVPPRREYFELFVSPAANVLLVVNELDPQKKNIYIYIISLYIYVISHEQTVPLQVSVV